MGPRPARCECRSRHEAAAGSRNPSCRASAFCTSNINDLQWFVKSKATFAGKPSQSSLRDASSPEGEAFRPLRHGLRRATSPKGRGKKRSRHALGSPLGRAAERSEAERAWPLKTARAQNLSQKRFRFVEISSPSRAVEQRSRPLSHRFAMPAVPFWHFVPPPPAGGVFPEGGAFRPLRHGLRRATSPKGRGKKRSRHALGSPLGRAAERSEAERAWPLKTARAQNLSQKRFRFVEISSPSRAVEQRLPLRDSWQTRQGLTERVPPHNKNPAHSGCPLCAGS